MSGGDCMRTLTPEQRAAVEDREGSLLLAANAGSGKTSVMVERFVRAVREDGAAVRELLAITFTDKAASELRERIRDCLLDLGEPERARETDGAYVSTIHGLCARLLRTHALRAGIDPDFAVLEEREAARLARAAFDRALEDRLAEAGEDALDAVAGYGPRPAREMILAAHELLRSRGDEDPDLPPPPAIDDPAAARAELERAAAGLAAELEAEREPGASVTEALERLGRCRAFLVVLGERIPQASELDAFKPNGARAAALRTPAAERFREAFARWRGACVDRHALPVYEHLRALLRDHARRYAELKRERSALDFTDLELKADALLREHSDLREAYAERFRHVMVDEFQDTNPLQLRILDRLVRDNAFEVGDELQSIYRFRNADVALFRGRRDSRAGAGRTRALSTNFRSRPELLAALNLAFAGVFGDRFMPLVAGTNDGGTAEAPLELLVTDKAGWEQADLGDAVPAAARWRLAEARVLARRVRELVDGGTRLRDVVVLLRATTDMGVFERALEDQGLATYLIGGRGFWSHQQVQDVTAYLALLANPRDDLRLHEVLASPIVGAGSDALAMIALDAEGAKRSAWEVVENPVTPLVGQLDPADRERLGAFVARFAAQRAAAPRLALDALIDRVVVDSGYDLEVLAMPGGERRLANVRKLMRLAREYEAAEGRDLRGLVDLVRELAGDDEWGEDREGEAPVEGEALDAVRLMTIHRAKGLEFPVVCVADLGREPRPGGRETLRVAADGRVGLRLPAANGERSCAFAWQPIADEEREEEALEERRLFYVAMTRAQDRLILSGAIDWSAWTEGRPRREPLAWIASAFAPDLAERVSPERPHAEWARGEGDWSARMRAGLTTAAAPPAPAARDQRDAVGPGGAERDAARVAAAPPAAAPPAPAPPAVDRLSYSALEDYGRCGYRFYLQRVLGLPDTPPPPGADPAREGLAAKERGVVAHALLERLDPARPLVPSLGEARAAAELYGHAPSEADLEDLVGLVARFAESPLRTRLAAAREVRREEPFAFVLDGVLVTGVVDVVAREGDRALVVDYKTDRLEGADPAALADRDYRVQRLVYALAALRDGFAEVEVAHCFLERPDDPAVARFARADRTALEAELATLAAGAVEGRFDVTPEPHRALCATCPGRPALCSWDEDMTLRELPPRA